MSGRTRLAFLLLVLAQAAHSVEEYAGRLYAVFPPARLASSAVSADPAAGFLALNTAIVAFGLWSWAVPVRTGWGAARMLAWGWALVELANGIGHSLLAIARGGYFPGVATAPLLIAAAMWLMALLSREAAAAPPPAAV